MPRRPPLHPCARRGCDAHRLGGPVARPGLGAAGTRSTSSRCPTSRCSRSRGCPRQAQSGPSPKSSPTASRAGARGRADARPRRRDGARRDRSKPPLRHAHRQARDPLGGRTRPRTSGSSRRRRSALESARRELARRYLHIFGPSTAAGFAKWAGIGVKEAAQTFDELSTELLPVRTPLRATRTCSTQTRR